jgi:hypothetical protein
MLAALRFAHNLCPPPHRGLMGLPDDTEASVEWQRSASLHVLCPPPHRGLMGLPDDTEASVEWQRSASLHILCPPPHSGLMGWCSEDCVESWACVCTQENYHTSGTTHAHAKE